MKIINIIRVKIIDIRLWCLDRVYFPRIVEEFSEIYERKMREKGQEPIVTVLDFRRGTEAVTIKKHLREKRERLIKTYRRNN